jgi:fatty acid desaturase
MLSRHERDRLAEIESALESDDPRLAEKFDRFDGGRSWGGMRRLLLFLVLALVALLALLCLVSGLALIAITLALGTAGAAAGIWWHDRRKQRG